MSSILFIVFQSFGFREHSPLLIPKSHLKYSKMHKDTLIWFCISHSLPFCFWEYNSLLVLTEFLIANKRLSTGILNDGAWIYSNIHGAGILNDVGFTSAIMECFWDRNPRCFLPLLMSKPPPPSSLLPTSKKLSKLLQEMSTSQLCVCLWCPYNKYLDNPAEYHLFAPGSWVLLLWYIYMNNKMDLVSSMLEKGLKLQKLLAKLLTVNSWGHFEKYRWKLRHKSGYLVYVRIKVGL